MRTATRLLSLLCYLCINVQVFAQSSESPSTVPGSYADASSPSGAYDPMKLDAIWQVNPTSGQLSVKIPFPTSSVGGRGPHVPLALLYNSASTVTLQMSFISSSTLYNIQFQWATGNLSGSNPTSPIGPWTMSGPGLNIGSVIVPDVTTSTSGSTSGLQNQIPSGITMAGSATQGCTILGPYLYIDEAGDIHDLNLSVVSGYAGSNSVPECTGAQAWASESTDGSDLLSSTDNLQIGGFSTLGGQWPTLIYPNGTRYVNGLLEDSNGNYAPLPNDANGRTPFTSTLSLKQTLLSANSQVSPTPYYGFLPGNYSVTTSNSTGGPQTYSVVIGQVSVAGYALPHPASANGSNGPLGEFQGLEAYESNGTGVSVGITPMVPSTINAVTSIKLPDPEGSAYSFSYDPTYGQLSQITYPSGGTVKFTWGICSDVIPTGYAARMSAAVVTDVLETIPAVTVSGQVTPSGLPVTVREWKYNCIPYVAYSGLSQTTVTNPDGSKTQYSDGAANGLGVINAANSAPTTRVKLALTYAPASAGGAAIESTATVYNSRTFGVPVGTSPQGGIPTATFSNGNTSPGVIATTYYGSSSSIQSQTRFIYDKYDNVIERDESDYYACTGVPCPIPSVPPGGWLKKTLTTYLWSTTDPAQPVFAYESAHIVNKPALVQETDGAGNLVAETAYYYDQFPLAGSVGTILNHDDATFTAGMVGPRGNLTTEKRCQSIASNSCTAWISRTTQYDLAGMPTTTTDFNGTSTTVSYKDVYQSGGPSLQTDSYPTKITTQTGATNLVDQYSYSYYTGQVVSHTDPNGNQSSYAYDSMNRLHSLTYPATVDGATGATGSGGVTYSYSDNAPQWSTTKTVTNNLSGGSTTVRTIYDGFGEVSAKQLYLDPSGNAVQESDTYYDASGRVYGVSNPYIIGSDASGTTSGAYSGQTTFNYDAAGRKTQQSNPDNSSITWQYQPTTFSFSATGACQAYSSSASVPALLTQMTDGNNFRHSSTSDGLGRLVGVQEPNSASTQYCYDANSNLIGVHQAGISGDTPRERTFTYDALSRLITSNNPESGTICFGQWSAGVCTSGYDGNGNLQSKTDARGIVTNYSYDLANRLTARSYPGSDSSSKSTAASCFFYDAAPGGVSVPNALGRMVAEGTVLGSPASACTAAFTASGASTISWKTVNAYDAMGRALSVSECPFGNCASLTKINYSYDLAGRLTSSTNGLPARVQPGFVANYESDDAGHLTTVSSSWIDPTHPAYLMLANQQINGISPFSQFGLTAAQYGLDTNTFKAAMIENRGYDLLGRLNAINVTGTIGSGSGISPVIVNPSPIPYGVTAFATAQCGTACGTGSGQLYIDGVGVWGTGYNYAPNQQLNIPVVTNETIGGVTLNVPPGHHSLYATFSGDATHPPSQSATVAFDVIQASTLAQTVLTMTTAASPLPAGQISGLNFQIGCATGVACPAGMWGSGFYMIDGSFGGGLSFDGSGNAQGYLQAAAATAGTHTLTAHYNGSGQFAPTDYSGSLVVTSQNLPVPTISIGLNPISIPYGESAAVAVNVACTPSCLGGHIYVDGQYAGGFMVDSTTGIGQQALWPGQPYMTIGQHTLSVQYYGDSQHAPAQTSVTFSIVPSISSSSNFTTLTASATPYPLTAGQSPAIQIHASCNAQCKTVFSTDGYITLDGTYAGFFTFDTNGNGTAYMQPNIGAGAHTVVAYYYGNSNYSQGQSLPITFGGGVPTYVQQCQTTQSHVTSLSCTVTGVTAGDVVMVGVYGSVPSSVTASSGTPQLVATDNNLLTAYALPVTTSGSVTITANVPASGTQYLSAADYTNVAQVPVDTQVQQQCSGYCTTLSSPTIATRGSETLWSFCSAQLGNQVTAGGSPLSWTVRSNGPTPMLIEDAVAGTAGSYAGQCSATGMTSILTVALESAGGPTPATPVITPASATFSGTQTVTITDATPNAVIHYTVDGSAPTPVSPVYSGPITVTSANTVYAIADTTTNAYASSQEARGFYALTSGTPTVAMPTFSPAAGTYEGTQTVTIADTSSGVTIHYTTDGSVPNASSPAYTGPISVAATEMINAIAVNSSGTTSQTGTATYHISIGPPVYAQQCNSYDGWNTTLSCVINGVTDGDTIVVGVYGGAGLPNGFSVAETNQTGTGPNDGSNMASYYVYDAPAGKVTITVTFPNMGHQWLSAVDITNTATQPVDTTATGACSGWCTTVSTTPFTTANSNELLWSMCSIPSGSTLSPGTSPITWTGLPTPAGSGEGLLVEDGLAATAGSYTGQCNGGGAQSIITLALKP